MARNKKKQEGEEEEVEAVEDKLNIIIAKLNDLQTEIKKIEGIEKALDFVSKEVEDLRKEIGGWKEEMKNNREVIMKLKAKVEDQDKEMFELKENMEYLLIREKACNAEIKGVKKNTNENLEDVCIRIGNKAGIKLNKKDILDTYRIQTNRKNDEIILVKFMEEKIRDEFVLKCRRARLNLESIGESGREPIYVNENLPWATRKLFAETLVFKKKENFKFCWIRKGKIFLRKDEGSKIKLIRSGKDINKD